MSKIERPKRTPVGTARNILTIPDMDPNYVYRWVYENPNRPGRVRRFEEGGYEVVKEDLKPGDNTVDRGSKVGSAVTRPDSGGMLVAMRILKEWYDEDQIAKQDKVNAIEDMIKIDALEGRIPGTNEKGYGTFNTFRRK